MDSETAPSPLSPHFSSPAGPGHDVAGDLHQRQAKADRKRHITGLLLTGYLVLCGLPVVIGAIMWAITR